MLTRTSDDRHAPDEIRELLRSGFARLAAGVLGARIHVTGFADPRGASDYSLPAAPPRVVPRASRPSSPLPV
ncbi:MAG: hypothetical protein U1F11_14275 [Steroidobacteraceae bacterium]